MAESRAGNLLIAHLLISLKSNERLWAIRSDRSRQMSDREWIAQVNQRKWATLSDSLSLLRGNEQMSNSPKNFGLNKSKILFLVYFIYEKIFFFLKNEWCERIAQVAHQKWATRSDLLTSLRGNERYWANRSGRSPKMSEWVNCSFAHFWAKNEQFTRKTDERIPSPGREPLLAYNSYNGGQRATSMYNYNLWSEHSLPTL